MPLLNSACKAAVEGFVNTENPDKKKQVLVDVLAVVLSFLVALVIVGFVGKLLWNNVVVELLSFAKPAKSFWQLVGLMLFVALISP